MSRGAVVSLGVTAVGAVVFAVLMVAGVTLFLAIAILLLLWLGAFVTVRNAPALRGPVVVALPLILVIAVLIWLVVILGGMGG